MNQNNKLANEKLKKVVEEVMPKEEKDNKKQILLTQITQEDFKNIALSIDSIIKLGNGLDKTMMITNLVNFLQSKVIKEETE